MEMVYLFPDEEKGEFKEEEYKRRNRRLDYCILQGERGNPTVEEVFRLWLSKKLEYKEIQKGSADRYETDFERFLVKTNFSKRRMKQIAADELEDFIRLQVAQNELTMKAYSGLRTIIRGTWMFAKKKKWTDISISQFLEIWIFQGEPLRKLLKMRKTRFFLKMKFQL